MKNVTMSDTNACLHYVPGFVSDYLYGGKGTSDIGLKPKVMEKTFMNPKTIENTGRRNRRGVCKEDRKYLKLMPDMWI